MLFIEANKMKGKGGFTITGQIGDVMKESMQAALTWVRSNAVSLGPYPFRREPLQASILVRRVPKRFYTGSLDFQATLARAPYTAMSFTLHAGGALSAAHFAVA